jgi:hypothetical protein
MCNSVQSIININIIVTCSDRINDQTKALDTLGSELGMEVPMRRLGLPGREVPQGPKQLQERLVVCDSDGTWAEAKDYSGDELDEMILEKVSKLWLFAGASIYGEDLLHEDYGKRLLGLDLQCTWQEKKYNILQAADVKIQSCTASSALAQAVLVHTAGWPGPLDVFKAAGVLGLPDVAAAAEAEDYTEHEVYYNMTEDRNKFMAYCMAMRAGGLFSGVQGLREGTV